MTTFIRKNSGIIEPFNIKKFKHSLAKAGASQEMIERLAKEIEQMPQIQTTRDIYNFAYAQLKKSQPKIASRYSLKNALYELGPEGFLFERFVAELFKKEQYSVKVDQIVPGICVDYEIDLVLTKEKDEAIVECKFHNMPGLKCDVKVTLYVKARADDIEAKQRQSSSARPITKSMLITNTQFTTKAIDYGNCVGMTLIGWAYPENGNIADLIYKHGLHPITSLTSLTEAEKKLLVQHEIFLCSQITSTPALLKTVRLNAPKIKAITDECHLLGENS